MEGRPAEGMEGGKEEEVWHGLVCGMRGFGLMGGWGGGASVEVESLGENVGG